jgi:hypothetical protein
MWKRRTFHDCAHELQQVSDRFRAAANGQFGANSKAIMHQTSVDGVEILRILSLSIRTEQDHGLTDGRSAAVGVLIEPAEAPQVANAIRLKRVTDHKMPLTLREALNKIAHLDPGRSTYRVDQADHVLILIGENKGKEWVAELSLPMFCTVILNLKDESIRTGG